MRRLNRPFTARMTAIAFAAACIAPAFALSPSVARAEESVLAVSSIDVTGEGNEATVIVKGTQVPTFTVFRLDRPSRVVIDLARADVTAIAEADALPGQGPLLSVSATQFDDPKARVGRLILTIADGTKYDVAASGNDLVVKLRHSNAPAAVAKAAPAEKTAPAVKAAAAVKTATVKVDDNVVRVEIDELPEGLHSGKRVTDVALSVDGKIATLVVRTDGPVARYQMIELKEPGRLALDLDGFESFEKPSRTAAGPVAAVRLGRHEGKVRIVVEGQNDRFPPFEIERLEKGLKVVIGRTPRDTTVAMKESEAEKPVAKTVAPTAAASTAKVAAVDSIEVRSIDVSGRGRTTRIVVLMTAEAHAQLEESSKGTHALTIKGVKLPTALARRLDASALEGPIASVSSFPVKADGDAVRLVVQTRDGEEATGRLTTMKVGPSVGLVWTFTGQGPRKWPAANTALAANTRAPGGFMGEAPAYAMAAAPRANYTGKRVDFTAKDLDIIQFLQAIGEVSKLNIVASDDVKGTVSIRLRNVPWDEALDIVLKTKGLGKQEVGNIIRVAPLGTLRKEDEENALAAETRQKIEPLKVRLIPVNYASAGDLAGRVKDVLSPRGTTSVDTRTNVLIVKDIVESLAKAEMLVRNLDTQTPQVLIEARIVEAQTSFTRSIGIQWGGDVKASPVTGNPTGLVFPNIVSVGGAATDGQTPTSGTSAAPNFAVNMPVAIGTNTGGGVGMIFGSAGGAANLNLRLSAAEVNGTIKTVSAPKVTAMDNEQATIGQGISVPFSQVSAAGVNTTFIEAKLQLDVTPHVTSDGSILLKIKAANNQPNPQLTGANGQPSISKREANTTVLVKDGDTTVIGGIYTRRNSLESNEVPFFSKIPIIGRLFSKQSVTDDRTEMLIFITPRIVNRQQSTVVADEAQ